jgi:hypothetical protein
MTKGVSLATTAPKSRDAALGPTAPSAKPDGDDGRAGSFAALLDTAAPTKTDEHRGEDRPDRAGALTEREGSHHHESAAAYLAPADSALAWLASRDVTTRSRGESAGGGESRPPNEIPESSRAEGASTASDSLDSASPTAGDGAASRADDEHLSSGLRYTETPSRTRNVIAELATEATNGASATSSDHRRSSSASTRSWLVESPVEADATARSKTIPAISTPAESTRDLAARRQAMRLAVDAVERPAAASTGDTSRDRGLQAIPRGDRQPEVTTTSPGSATAEPAMPSAVSQSRPGEVPAREDGEPVAPGQAGSIAFVAANTELAAAITKAQRGADGSYSLRALLNPPSLGRVDATIKVNGESVEVAITPHTAEGHEALSRHLDELQRELASDHSEVHLSLTDGGGQSRHGNDPKRELITTHPGDEVEIDVEATLPTPDSSLHIIL